MPRDRGLEELIRSELPDEPFTEKSMFGGYAWLLHGNLVCGARGDGLLARLGKGQDGWALALAGIVPMTVRDRTMEGWVRAAPEAFGDDQIRQRLLEAAVAFARLLPPKAISLARSPRTRNRLRP